MAISRIVWIVLLLLPGAALVALGLYVYGGDEELSHAYGGFTIVIGMLLLLGGEVLALPRKRLTPRQR
jgi:hypothetical protein